MRFLLDQDVYAATTKFLADWGHDVVRAAELGMAQASDEKLLEKAHEQNRIFVTRDRDYGNLVFVRGMNGGVLYLRMLPSNQDSVHAELENVLLKYPENDLKNAFVVVEAGGHRFRKI